MEKLPALRFDIDLVPVSHEGRRYLLVRDPLGLASPDLALNAGIAPLLALFDGTTTFRDLQSAFAREQGGALLEREKIAALVEQLDGFVLLQTERYREARRRVVEEFAQLPERPAALAGSAYPEDPEALAAELDGHLAVGGGGAAPAAGAERPCAVAAPHIDLRAAGPSYGIAYGPLRPLSPPAILLLGTGHSLDRPYCLTGKTFGTPLGRVHAEIDGVRRLREAGGGLVAPDDFAHRGEHSLEFQLLFLQRLFPMAEVPVVPLLCGSLEHFFPGGRDPLESPAVRRFIGELRAWLAAPPAGKLVVAGVDLAHVGPKFGDERPAPAMEKEFRASDRDLLRSLEAGDAGAFFAAGARDGNRYKVCGFSALWTLLAALPGVRGEVLDYRVWHEAPTQSAVSFAALVFRRQRAGG